jgi:hypothetical protein
VPKPALKETALLPWRPKGWEGVNYGQGVCCRHYGYGKAGSGLSSRPWFPCWDNQDGQKDVTGQSKSSLEQRCWKFTLLPLDSLRETGKWCFLLNSEFSCSPRCRGPEREGTLASCNASVEYREWIHVLHVGSKEWWSGNCMRDVGSDLTSAAAHC